MPPNCDVTFKSNLANLKEHFGQNGIRHTVDQQSKWSDILTDFELNPNVFYLKSCDGKNSVSLLDKVEDYTKQFKKTLQHYIVYIHKMDKRRQQEFAQLQEMNRVRKSTKNQRNGRTISPAKASQPSAKRPRVRKSDQMNNNNHMEFEEDGFPEVGVQFSYNDAGISGIAQPPRPEFDEEYDDGASQDSQDLGTDIKAQIVDKLVKGVSNGDMYRVRNELTKLKAEGKYLKASRFLPFTLTMLQNVFME